MGEQRKGGFAGAEFVVFLACLSAGGVTGAAQEPASATVAKDELVATGEDIYNDTCAGCHQVNGMGIPAFTRR
jgi:mono/diheme cytochrome c family protein